MAAARNSVRLIEYADTAHVVPLMTDLDVGDVVQWLHSLY